MRQNREGHSLGKELGINRYLVDTTGARNTDTIKDSYDFAYADMRNTNDIDKTAVVALLVSPVDHSHDFIETVARNTGLNVTQFTERRLAGSFLGNECLLTIRRS